MTHLYIELNGITEEVNSLIIEKLYNLASSGDLDETSDLKGRLHSTSARDIHYNYLNNNFLDLYITADKIYLTFADPAVELVLATNWGDSVGITTTLVSSIQHFNRKFYQNGNILTFDELYLFPNITEINLNNLFSGCTNLKSIDLRNITKVSGSNGYERFNFENCTNLESIGNTLNLTYLGHTAFFNCSKLKHIDTTNVTEFRDNCLYNCTGILDTIVLNQLVTYVGGNSLYNVPTLPDTINLPNLEALGDNAFYNTTIKHVVDLGKITTIGSVWPTGGPFTSCLLLLDVVLPETITTVNYGGLSGCNNIRYVKLLANEVPVYNMVDGHGNVWDFGLFFLESYNPWNDPITGLYNGKTYPIYVKDELLSQYQAADGWKYVGPNRLRPLSLFSTDFPNG